MCILIFCTFFAFWAYKTWLHLDNSVHIPYWSRLSWSFLHGRVDIMGADPTMGDLTPYKGRVYAYWPPLTAILMIPLVWLRGPDDFPQRIFGIFFAAINTGLLYLLIERFSRSVNSSRPAWLPIVAAFFFGWGTSNLVFGIIASHWFVSQLTASTFFLLALWLVTDRHPERRLRSTLLGACFFAVATAGRQHLILALPLWLFLALSDQNYVFPGKGPWTKRLATCIVQREYRWRVVGSCIPLVLVLGLMLWYNHVRFGQWFENGLTFHNVHPVFYAAYQRHGYFSPYYLARNIYDLLLRFPGFERWDGQDRFMGFSLLIQCPILFLAFGSGVSAAFRPLANLLWITCGLVSLPIFLIYNPGASQFGARYLHDIVPFLIFLIILKEPDKRPIWFISLGILSVAINLLGPLYVLGEIHF